MNERRYARRVTRIGASGIRKLFDAGGADAINLGIGQPDFDTPAHIKEAAIRAIREGKTGYTPNAGIPGLRSAICEKLSRENSLTYTPDELIVTAGGSEAIHLVMQALVDDGDRVLFADPGFVSYQALATVAGGRSEGVALDAALHIDIEKAKEQMDGARLFILNSPANPTGAVESPDAIRALVEYANDRGVTVVSDEVYEHFVYEKEHCSAARYGEDVITINAASKTYAMTGWRVGFLAAPEEYVEQCMKVHQYCQACATSISQYAALAAYTGDQGAVRMMRDEYRARRDLLYDGLTEIGLDFPRPEGAFYMFVPMGRTLIRQAIEKGVIIVPGEAFGTNMPEHARFSYATSQENLRRAVERLKTILE
ncbi:pyridoxal phosphate-dependent aminotransferase [Methanoculleus sp. FWC-SCC1]|uniref:Pyridoxal phosphate-dependent aminotransferase n=1 Tax=Methanoculleus frigidifontis TaxID=2584085 RepID=A0ABT8M6M1_9EURY|nr:pyridoxal phosphate-dependent aminotransferase [Methanoculleus sp. FWC-SCC1]MDN7023539.1 pyridoxal phosphate-dependent aminotransferase [Methanoculleus sp. FWC-SCC1]